MNIEGNLYLVYRKYPQYEELGYNEVLVCAKNANQAKGIALAKYSSLYNTHIGDSKKDILVKKIDKVEIGDVLCSG